MPFWGKGDDSANIDSKEREYLDTPLIRFTDAHEAVWTIRDACEGTQVFGATGSGKTSGSGQTIAKAFLKAGFGGLVLTAKSDETTLWENYIKETGREDDFTIFSPESNLGFNFLNYELSEVTRGSRITENVVQLFLQVLDVSKRQQNAGSRDPFWDRAVEELLRNTIDLLRFASGRVTVPGIVKTVATAPRSLEEAISPIWRNGTLCGKCLLHADELLLADKNADDAKKQDWQVTKSYWENKFPRMPERTRQSVVAILDSLVSIFTRSPLREMFCTSTSDEVDPKVTHEGKIIILDISKQQFDYVGQYAQVLYKYVWQRAAERREVGKNTKPIFLWVDEAQFFVSSNDWMFQSLARSKRVCTVYLTQNLPSYYSIMQGNRAEHEANSLLGNFQTKIFHANGDHVTNEWAAESIGKRFWSIPTTSWGQGVTRKQLSIIGETSSSNNLGEHITEAYDVRPRDFLLLKKGGPQNSNKVSTVIFQGGKSFVNNGSRLNAGTAVGFDTGDPFVVGEFDQEFPENSILV